MARRMAILLRTGKRTVRRTRNRLDRRPVAHFMHLDKTAGTALRLALRDVRTSTSSRLVLHGHGARLKGIPEGQQFFFCVRDPIDRYVSGFMSRLRQGRPRFDFPWKEEEARAFSRFASPDDLAVALSAGSDRQLEAEDAMRSIRHVRSSYWDWFSDPDYFRSRSGDLLWIGRVGNLELGRLAVALGVDELTMPRDTVAANRTTSSKPELSDLGRHNLQRWYAKDYAFLELCDEVFPPNT